MRADSARPAPNKLDQRPLYIGLSLQHVTVAKVIRLLRGLKSGKSSSFDGLDNFSIKLAADIRYFAEIVKIF